MRRNYSPYLVLTFALAIICQCVSPVKADEDAKVTRVSSETEDSIAFRVSAAKKTFAKEEDIRIDYLVKNRGRRAVYLVVKPSPKLLIQETFFLELASPIIYPDPHNAYSYEFIKVLPGRAYSGKLMIKPEQFLPGARYNFEVAAIRVGFSYLFDISGHASCMEASYTLPCLKEVYDKMKTVMIGNLVVEIKQ